MSLDVNLETWNNVSDSDERIIPTTGGTGCECVTIEEWSLLNEIPVSPFQRREIDSVILYVLKEKNIFSNGCEQYQIDYLIHITWCNLKHAASQEYNYV